MNYVYIVECKDGTFYTGWTNDLENRIKQHNAGNGCKYTKMRYPVVLKYLESFESKNDAMKRESAIKMLTRAEKIELISKKNC